MAVVLHHLFVNHHQCLHVQFFVPMGLQKGPLVPYAWLILIRQDEKVFLGRLGHVYRGAFREEMNVKLSRKTSCGTRAKENGF